MADLSPPSPFGKGDVSREQLLDDLATYESEVKAQAVRDAAFTAGGPTSTVFAAGSAVALIAGACGRSLRNQPWFTPDTRSAFYDGGFYANDADMARRIPAPGHESRSWGCTSSTEGIGDLGSGNAVWHGTQRMAQIP